jgi:hypothetical protein
MANKAPRALREEIQEVMSEDIIKRSRKSRAKVPKTAGHGLRGKPEPYKGPGKPTNNASVGRKPTLITTWPAESPDHLTQHKPNKWPNEYNGSSDGFRSWRGKHPFGKNGNGNGRK